MAKVILYCAETPNLKLGPGIKVGDPDVIVFVDGYAEIDTTNPIYPNILKWIEHPGTPLIRILEADETPVTNPDAVICDQCGKAFATDRQLNGHLISHRRQG